MRKGARHEQSPAQRTEAELLRAIRDGVRSTYADILRRPLPPEIQAVLLRLDEESDLENRRWLEEPVL